MALFDARRDAAVCLELRDKPTLRGHHRNDADDAVDGAHSAASECHRVVASKRTTLRGAVHGRS